MTESTYFDFLFFRGVDFIVDLLGSVEIVQALKHKVPVVVEGSGLLHFRLDCIETLLDDRAELCLLHGD